MHKTSTARSPKFSCPEGELVMDNQRRIVQAWEDIGTAPSTGFVYLRHPGYVSDLGTRFCSERGTFPNNA